MSNLMTPFATPTGLFHDLRREMDTTMRQFFDCGPTGEGASELGLQPRLDLAETDQRFEISVDLPGVSPDEVSVEVRDGNLWISGKHTSEKEEGDKTWRRVERSKGEFRRIVGLGQQADPEQIEAEFRDGVLKISVGKTAEDISSDSKTSADAHDGAGR